MSCISGSQTISLGAEHQEGVVDGFTQKYHLTRLVYFEPYDDVRDALAREKQLRNWRREKKIKLIESIYPSWSDLTGKTI